MKLSGRSEQLYIVGVKGCGTKRIFGIPDFQYYAIADGLKAILALFGKGINIKNSKKEENLQMALLL